MFCRVLSSFLSLDILRKDSLCSKEMILQRDKTIKIRNGTCSRLRQKYRHGPKKLMFSRPKKKEGKKLKTEQVCAIISLMTESDR